MRQLVPRLGECVRELLRVVMETFRNRRIDRVQLQCEVRGEHERGVLLRRIVCIGNGARSGSVLGSPLVRTGGALREFPLIAEQVVEVVVAPLRWRGAPCALQSAGDRRAAIAGAKRVFPAEALLLDAGALRFGADILAGIGSAMGFSECVTA